MAAVEIIKQRLAQQRLSQDPFEKPEEVVAWLGAVQAQDYPGAKWALGMRLKKASDEGLDAAFNAGKILRTHVMRPTWHFVAPEDIRWLLELTAPRVNAVNAHMYRQLELDETLFNRSRDAIASALEGGQALTRAELGKALAEAGIQAAGMRLGYIVHRAELEALVCSGPRHGKQFTYTLLAERAPQARSLPRDEALAELTGRYYTGHGPATVQDFAWWSGLTQADVKAGLDMVRSELSEEKIGGQTYYFSVSRPPAVEPQEAYLLPVYDELLVGYSMFNKSRVAGQVLDQNLVFDATLLFGGRFIGSWRRTIQRLTVILQIAPFASLSAAEEAAVESAARRFGDFLGLTVLWTMEEDDRE
jgi:hypothetical protein